jgi:hypothetical protein
MYIVVQYDYGSAYISTVRIISLCTYSKKIWPIFEIKYIQYSMLYLVSAYMNLELITWHGRIGLRSGVDPVRMTTGLCPTLYVSPVKKRRSFIQA